MPFYASLAPKGLLLTLVGVGTPTYTLRKKFFSRILMGSSNPLVSAKRRVGSIPASGTKLAERTSVKSPTLGVKTYPSEGHKIRLKKG